jgi:hypothetical protein
MHPCGLDLPGLFSSIAAAGGTRVNRIDNRSKETIDGSTGTPGQDPVRGDDGIAAWTHRPAPRDCLALPWVGPLLLFFFFLLFPLPAEEPPVRGEPGGSASDARAKAARILERMAEVADLELARPGARPWDFRARAAELGNDPERVLAFVRDEVAFEPYEGVLRGSEGVLLAGGGNALEKAILLADMLLAGGTPARIVRGKLPREDADRLLRSFLSRSPLSAGPLRDFLEGARRTDSHRELAERIGFRWEDVERSWKAAEKTGRDLLDEAHRLTLREASILERTLEEADIKLGAGSRPRLQAILEGIAEHAWVRYHHAPSGEWRDLDPSFPEARPGGASASREQDLEEARREDETVLAFRLVMRRSRGGKEEDITLLDRGLPVSQCLHHPLRFRVVPADPEAIASREGEGPEETARRWAGFKRFQAVLSRGREDFGSLVFDLDGGTHAVSGDGRIEGARRLAGAAGGLLGGGLGGEEEAAESDGKLLRLWVELSFVRKGVPEMRQERVLLDPSISPAPKRWVAIEWDLLVQPHLIPSAYFEARALEQASRLAPLVARAVGGASSSLPGESSRALREGPSSLLSFAATRQAALARMLQGSRQAEQVLLWTRPHLIAGRQALELEEDGKGLCLSHGIDLVENGYWPIIPSAEPDIDARLALRLGVLDTVLEELVTPQSPCARRSSGAISYFAGRRMEGRGEMAVAAPGSESFRQLDMPPVTREWISRALPGGGVVVAPAARDPREPDYHWWAVDPVLGHAVGRDRLGGGQDMTEYNIIATFISFQLCFFGWAFTGSSGWRTICCFLWSFGGYKITQTFWQITAAFAFSIAGFVTDVAHPYPGSPGGFTLDPCAAFQYTSG